MYCHSKLTTSSLIITLLYLSIYLSVFLSAVKTLHCRWLLALYKKQSISFFFFFLPLAAQQHTLSQSPSELLRARLSDTEDNARSRHAVNSTCRKHTLVRAQSHSKHRWKSLTPQQSRKYQQPQSHSRPHTAFPSVLTENEWKREKWGGEMRVRKR